MIWLAALGGGSFVLVSLVLGPRLLALARRTQQIPEFTMGFCLLLMGGLGYPLASVARAATALPDDIRGLLLGCSALCNSVGFAALAIFTWCVFRPRSAVAELGVAAGIAALAVLIPAEAVWPGLVAGALSRQPYPAAPGYLRVAIGLGVLYWASLEAALFTSRLRRQRALGLADPVVADRVRLWTVAISCASISYSAAFVLALRGIDIATSPVGAGIVGALGLASAGSTWLAFLPPTRYVAWVRSRAAA